MGLPDQLKTARMSDSTLVKNVDNKFGDLEKALAAMLPGVTIDVDVTDVLAPHARALVNSVAAWQSLAASTWVKVAFDGAESYDDFAEFDNATNFRFTAKKPGWYLFMSTVRINNVLAATGIMSEFYKNGTGHGPAFRSSVSFGATGGTILNNSVIQLNGTTDYVELYVNSGDAGNIEDARMSITKLRIL